MLHSLVLEIYHLEWALWTGHIIASFNLAGLRQSLTFPFGPGTSMKLLHYSVVLSIPRGVIISCCCCHSSSSLNGLVEHRPRVLVVPNMVCCLLSMNT